MLISSGIRRASKIIAVSEYTKRDIANHYGIDENKIEVVHEGVHENYKAVKGSDKTRQVLKRYGIPDQYVLYVGRLHEGKNLIRLLQAYARVRKQGQADYRLVFVGRELFNALPIYREVSRLGLGKEVIFSGYVEGKDLPVIYSHAAAFVYPSLFEGFGLPPLEAMACGTPVLSSSAGSLEEVIGDGGLLFDPCSLDQMTESLDRILRDKSLREDLRQRGFKRASLFSWENAAKKTLKVYQQA
jgi:glycosyltransferase involved in cell wall biosynthesis